MISYSIPMGSRRAGWGIAILIITAALLLQQPSSLASSHGEEGSHDFWLEPIDHGLEVHGQIAVDGVDHAEIHLSKWPNFVPSNATHRATLKPPSVEGNGTFAGALPLLNLQPNRTYYGKMGILYGNGTTEWTDEQAAEPLDQPRNSSAGDGTDSFPAPSLAEKKRGVEVTWDPFPIENVTGYQILTRDSWISGQWNVTAETKPTSPLRIFLDDLEEGENLLVKIRANTTNGTTYESRFESVIWTPSLIINSHPVASFIVEGYTADVGTFGERSIRVDPGTTLVFNGSASRDDDPDPLTYNWTWGDGTPNGHGMIASHSYAEPGRYEVRLVVTDWQNATNSNWPNMDELTVIVEDPEDEQPEDPPRPSSEVPAPPLGAFLVALLAVLTVRRRP